MAFRQHVRIGSRDIDMQRVVASASYLTFVSDIVDAWLRDAVDDDFEQAGWDAMLKRAVLDWQSPARLGDLLELEASVAGWGNTSFVIGVVGRVGERPVFAALATYVSVRHDTTEAIPTPSSVRAALGEAHASPVETFMQQPS